MPALAYVHDRNVIDLAEVRRQRAMRAMQPCGMPMPAAMPVAWMPVWIFVPVWTALAAVPGVSAG